MDKDIINKLQIAPVPEHGMLQNRFNSALKIVDDIVLKKYISRLQTMDVVPLDNSKFSSSLSEDMRFFKITEMVYEKDEFATYKFASVFNSIATSKCAVFIIVDSNGEKTDFYMGIRNFDEDRTISSLKETLNKAMIGQFPGVKTYDCSDEDMTTVLNRIKSNSISVVSSVANSKQKEMNENKYFIQGLEKLASSMNGEKYSAVIIANGTSKSLIDGLRKGYEDVFTQLSPFANTQMSYANNTSLSLSEAISKGSSKASTESYSISNSEGVSDTDGKSVSESVSQEALGSRAVKGVASASAILGAALSPVTGGASLVVGGMLSGGFGLLGAAIQKTETHSNSTNTSITINKSNTEGKSTGISNGTNESNTDTQSIQSGTSQNLTLSLQDKTIVNLLERLDMQMKRLKEFESLGMWECAAYFMSEKVYISEMVASTYKAIMRGEDSGVEISAINSWNNKAKTNELRAYITNCIHPVFLYRSSAGNIEVTASSYVSGNELALHMGLPRKSVCGLPVIEHAAFAKEVVTYNNYVQKKLEKSDCDRLEPVNQNKCIRLGNVFDMGSICKNRVELNLKSLSMHSFITGSTGSGKSNTVFEMIQQLESLGIKFMIIEPAKGEYKNIFGNKMDAVVLGSNPKYCDLLKINPFRFPSQIHILEHVDRLIEIFNVCWPMYAAMPAVLKNAVLQAYEVCGWDLIESLNQYSNDMFPTFMDLQTELTDVIESSAYSQELKSNYHGALSTRVKSLTNGLNGLIFSATETDNTVLFDKNVIIDLSRIGSMETKSLIMGILIMRLNEHRMSNTTGMNVDLKHVTVLEEAHYILKRTSTDQNIESPSISSKSVEMLSNAIAEMRTYGEGFIIVDQSPSAVDLSAIRNTNTKIILRLPDEADRRLSGKSAALKDEQLDEIAKLPKGVAVVYQNDWVEPVLCQVNKFYDEEIPYQYKPVFNIGSGDLSIKFNKELMLLLLKGRTVEKLEPDTEFLSKVLNDVIISTKNKLDVRSLLNEYNEHGCLDIWTDRKFSILSAVVTDLVCSKKAIESLTSKMTNFESLNDSMIELVNKSIPNLSEQICLSICQCLMKEFSKDSSDKFEIYSAWRKHTTGVRQL